MTQFYDIRPGQLWRCSDPRRFKICRVVSDALDCNAGRQGSAIKMLNIVTGFVSTVHRSAFRTGTHGWSMERNSGRRWG